MRAALTHPAWKLSRTSVRLDTFVCYVFVVKRIKFKTNLVFPISLAAVYTVVSWIYVLPALSFQLSVFSKFCIMNTLLHFLLLCQSCRSLRNVSLIGCILGLIKSAYHGWLSMMTSSEGPHFSLASGPPTLNPPLDTVSYFHWRPQEGRIEDFSPQLD